MTQKDMIRKFRQKDIISFLEEEDQKIVKK